jgi:hypothetical protein
MQNGGHITGYHISKEDAGEIAEDFIPMKNKDFLYAVGDGNHSLAAAKECWEQKKKTLSADEAKHPKQDTPLWSLSTSMTIHLCSSPFTGLYSL